MIIFENTPYREDKDLIKAYNSFMEVLPEDGWALFRDADTLFLDPFYGEVINRAIRNNPDAGCFTCLTNRIGNNFQLHDEYTGDDITIHRTIAERIKAENYNCYDNFSFDIKSGSTLSGMLMVINKSTWQKIRGFKKSTIKEHARGGMISSNILGVDNQLHKDLHNNNIKLKIIKEMYIYHWYRGGDKTKKDHLKANTKYVHVPPTTKDADENKKAVPLSNTKKFIERRRRK